MFEMGCAVTPGKLGVAKLGASQMKQLHWKAAMLGARHLDASSIAGSILTPAP